MTSQQDAHLAGSRRRVQPVFLKTPVQPPNATAVVNRLRAAIDLGVVRGGEALPREAVLARQLGVSAFVLRDALSSLRAEGLLTTRPGRGGGSFVTERSRPPLTASSEHLNPVSASAIRDLADWRATLLSGSASIACERVTRADLDHLRELALDVDDAARAPRALGTFVIQLAAAAQSTRLSIAAMTLQEEAGAMFSLPLRAAEYRANLSAALVLLVDSVGGRVPEAAANAAGAASQIELEALLRLRLTALTPTRDVRRGDGLDDPRTIATAAQSHVDEIMSRLTMFAESAGHEMTAIIRDEHGLDEGLLALDRASFDAISAMPRTVHGCGVLFRAGVLPENRLAGAWFVREASQILRHPHEFDETQPDFYDYSRAAWMSETPIVVGPYVDSGGVDDYVLTLAVPVLTAAGFIGVAAADMPVEQFELEFAPQLLTAGPMSLVNREGRVIVSTVPAVTPGTLLRSGPETDSFAVGTFGWRVITTHG